MLENARKQGASIFVYLIFCLLIVIFVINFGPQGGNGGGCSGTSNVILAVDGKEVTQASYQMYYSTPYNNGQGSQKRYFALEFLIRRELLAQEAERRDLRVTKELVEEQIKKGHFFIGGERVEIPSIFDENGLWNMNAFKNWIGGHNVRSRSTYEGEQQRGMLAYMMAQLLEDSVEISRDEALAHYLFENNTVQYDVVAFKPDPYRAAMKLTDADVDRFLATHGSEVEAKYKADERTYKGTKPALKLRQIFIAKLEEPTPEPPPAAGSAAGSAQGSASAPASGSAAGSASAPAASAAGSAAAAKPGDKTAKTGDAAKPGDKTAKTADAAKPGDKTAKTGDAAKPADKPIPVGMKIEDAKAKLETARAAIASNKQKFVDAAKQLSTDDAMKASGGDLGWRTTDNAMLGDKAVSDAIKTLKPGEMTPVITTNRGAYLIMAEAKREGDLSYEQVKHDIAKELARDVWSKEAAKRAALSALDKARSGTGLNLDQMYDKQTAPERPAGPTYAPPGAPPGAKPNSDGSMDIQQMLNDPNVPAEQKEMILKMLKEQQQKREEKSGAIVIEGKDQPASWTAQADGPSGSAAPKPTGSAAAPKPDPKAAGSAAAPKPDPKAAGSAAAQAGGSANAGSAAGGIGTSPSAAAGTPGDLTPSKDQLPAFADVAKPTVARHGPAPRGLPMAGIGGSKAAVDALFEELSPGMLAKRVYEGDNGYVVMQLISRSQPKVEDFNKDADRLTDELRRERGQSLLKEWLLERCEKLVKENRIRPNPALLRETDEKGNPLPITYKPCMFLR